MTGQTFLATGTFQPGHYRQARPYDYLSWTPVPAEEVTP